VLVLALLQGGGCGDSNEIKSCSAAGNAAGGFLGRWDLTIRQKDWQCPSWLEVSEEDGELKARFVGRWGNARYLPRIEIKGDKILFVSPKEEEDSENDLIFRGRLKGGRLAGTARGPNNVRWKWTGKRAPALKPAAEPQWGEPKLLFNGKDFTGWTFDNPAKASSWKVENETLVNTVAGSNIVTTEKFGDFKLHVEVNCPKKANSGIYLRGRYEIQVEDGSIAESPNRRMGAVYGFLAPEPEQPRRPGEWQSFDITFVGRYVTVVQNGKTIINNKEIPGITGGALDSHEELPGPIYLQGDHGGIAYRNIVLTPAKP
jgi:hypothetical protein